MHRIQTQKKNRGAAVIGVVLLFLVISSTIVFGVARSVFHSVRSAMDFNDSRASYFLSEALVEDTAYRFMRGYTVPTVTSLTLDGYIATGTVADIVGGKELRMTGTYGGLSRNVRVRLTYGAGGSFFYGVQVGIGGLSMYNSSEISGNVHSAGTIIGHTGGTQTIRGDAISSGVTGRIEEVYATSSAYAHTIHRARIDKDAYYVDISNSTVGGTSYPNSPDQPSVPLPISDEQIDEWEQDAVSGGTAVCTDGQYVIEENTTIGPKKIPCDLLISGNPTITLSGALWVVGDIIITNNPILKVSSIFIDRTIPIVANDPLEPLMSGTIDFQNASEFQGSGTNSYILFISRNRSAENGGDVDAIKAGNNLTGEVLLYAPHGNVTLSNSVSLREVTSYKLTLRNSAAVRYKSGLASLLFASGPSGGFEIYDWREVK